MKFLGEKRFFFLKRPNFWIFKKMNLFSQVPHIFKNFLLDALSLLHPLSRTSFLFLLALGKACKIGNVLVEF